MNQLSDISNVAIRQNLSKFLEGKNLSDKELQTLNLEYVKNAFVKTKIDLHIQKILKKWDESGRKSHGQNNEEALTSLSEQIKRNENQNVSNVQRFAQLLSK